MIMIRERERCFGKTQYGEEKGEESKHSGRK